MEEIYNVVPKLDIGQKMYISNPIDLNGVQLEGKYIYYRVDETKKDSLEDKESLEDETKKESVVDLTCNSRSEFNEEFIKFLHIQLPDLRFIDFENIAEFSTKNRMLEYKKIIENDRIVIRPRFKISNNVIKAIKALYGRYITIWGDFQAIKTLAIMAISLRLWLSGISSIIILRPLNSDLEQIKARFSQFIDNAKQYLLSKNVNIVYLDIEFVDKSLSEEEFNEFIQGGKTSKIFVSIGHSGNLVKSIVNKLKRLPLKKNYSVLSDEADLTDPKNNSNISNTMDIIKENAYCSFGISATPLDILMERKVTQLDLILLNRPKNYKSIMTFTHYGMFSHKPFHKGDDEDDKKATYTGTEKGNILKNDEGMITFLKYFSTTTPEYASGYGEYHPRICLINVAITNNPMYNLMNYIIENYDNITICLLGKSQLVFYSPIITTSIKLSKGNDNFNDKTKIHYITGAGISDIYKYMRDNGGVTKFPRIITIAGKLADRGLSFTSGRCTKTSDKMHWHLTDLRIIVTGIGKASGIACPNLLQRCSRLALICDDNIPLNIHCTIETYNTIIKSYICQDELIHRFKEIQEEMYAKDAIPTIPMNKKDKCVSNHPTLRKTLKI